MRRVTTTTSACPGLHTGAQIHNPPRPPYPFPVSSTRCHISRQWRRRRARQRQVEGFPGRRGVRRPVEHPGLYPRCSSESTDRWSRRAFPRSTLRRSPGPEVCAVRPPLATSRAPPPQCCSGAEDGADSADPARQDLEEHTGPRIAGRDAVPRVREGVEGTATAGQALRCHGLTFGAARTGYPLPAIETACPTAGEMDRLRLPILGSGRPNETMCGDLAGLSSDKQSKAWQRGCAVHPSAASSSMTQHPGSGARCRKHPSRKSCSRP